MCRAFGVHFFGPPCIHIIIVVDVVVVYYTKDSSTRTVGADSMGTMGAIAPTAKKLWDDSLKSPHRNFVVIFERVKCSVKLYECVIMPVTKVVQISA